MESSALLLLRYFLSCEQDLLICPKSYIFVKCKGSFTPKVKLIRLRLKEVLLNLTPRLFQHEVSENKLENKVTQILYVNLKVMNY